MKLLNSIRTNKIHSLFRLTRQVLGAYKHPYIEDAPDKILGKLGYKNGIEDAKTERQFLLKMIANPAIEREMLELAKKSLLDFNYVDLFHYPVEYAPIHLTLHLMLEDLKGKRILQLACSYGPYIYYLKNSERADASGIDISDKAVEYAKENNLDIRAGSAAEKTSFGDNEFDAVFSVNFLAADYPLLLQNDVSEFGRFTQAVLTEVHRLLKPEGIYISAGEIFADLDQFACSPFEPPQKYSPETCQKEATLKKIRVFTKI